VARKSRNAAEASSLIDLKEIAIEEPDDGVFEVDPKGWTNFGRRLDGAAG